MQDYSRRTALKIGASAMAAGMAPRQALGDAGRMDVALQAAAYGDVELLDGPLLDQFRAQHRTLLAMDEDALLKPFRVAAGQPAPGPDLGGWYNASPNFNPPADFHGYIPGHCFGQYVSGLARAYAVTGDQATREKVGRLVAGFAPTVTTRFYDGYPLPAYTYDKTAIGLLDAHEFAGDPTALKTLSAALDAALPHLPEKALTREEQEARPHPSVAYTWDETYTLPENMYLAWRRGAGERFRKLARRFLLDKEYFDPLAQGENALPGTHAYSHVNALSSAMQAYLCDGSAKHLAAARNGFDFVLAQSFATGGWGPNEGFVAPGSGKLSESLRTTHASFETNCGSYGHFKAARYLMAVTGDSRYGDSMERVLYNTVLGALPMKPDGMSFYYSDYNATGSKFYHEYACTCCSGTIGQVVADYHLSAYFKDEAGVYVNLYVPSRLRFRGRAVALHQTTRYPLVPETTIAIETPRAETFTIALRIPAWSGPGTRVTVNDRAVDAPIVPGHFLKLRRTWNDRDRIAIVFDMPLSLEAVDDKHQGDLAVMQGPLALFAVGERFLPFRRKELLGVKQVGQSAEWTVTTGDGTQRFKPFYAIAPMETTRLYQPVPA
jgi:hypothetical protein